MKTTLSKRLFLGLALSLGFLSLRAAEPELKVPNDHEFISLRNLSIEQQEGKTVLKGQALRTKRLPFHPASHLHIDYLNAQGETLQSINYRFPNKAFEETNDRFFAIYKEIDAPSEDVATIQVELYTNPHGATCDEIQKQREQAREAAAKP